MIQVTAEDFEKKVMSSETAVVVEFTADWCGVCKRSQGLMDILEKELSDVKFFFVDIEKDRGLAEKYTVKGVPTTFVFERGEQKARKTGALTKGDLYSMLGRKPVKG